MEKLKAIQVELEFPPTARLDMLRGETVVVKYGGHAIAGGGLDAFAHDVAYLVRADVRVVVVHGGGPEISEEMERAGLQPKFVNGHRVTDAQALEIAERVLHGRINRTIVSALEKAGCRAVGLSGRDGSLIRARYRRPKVTGPDGQETTVDLGYVGDVDRVNTRLLALLQGGRYTPVIAPLGVTASGQGLNINADRVAGAIAGALKAVSCVFLTDVEGVMMDPKDPATLQRQLRFRDVEAMVASGVVSDGMVPKVKACLDALASGAHEARIAGAGNDHALLKALLPAEPSGTAITP
ncbi:MAG TPA: acetylglutamate kinase [Candidatus Thermoplasmatota archaeon]